ncbi:MAG: hypothetical protein IH866_00405 [Chloroflexi bacterium]|nr:hypothetical protein [Chloroflexota bacterium]
MGSILTGRDELRRMFASLVEHTFHVELGVVDPRLIDYLADMLVRFIRYDSLFRIRDTEGLRLEEVAEMILEAEQRQARPQREIYRHIGDFTLFWAGVYPEALRRLRSPTRKDHLIDYCQQGKRSYYIASTFDDEPYRSEAPVLRRLSRDFELCSYGLSRIRREWERLRHAGPAQSSDAEWN